MTKRSAVAALAIAGAALGLTACQPSEYDYAHTHHTHVMHHYAPPRPRRTVVVHHVVTHVVRHTVTLRKGRR